jgi:hypothetical protein
VDLATLNGVGGGLEGAAVRGLRGSLSLDTATSSISGSLPGAGAVTSKEVIWLQECF